MISQTTEYALRAVVYLAQHPEESWTTRQIAGATHVPAGYLSKVLQGLTRAGLIASQRGRHGGFQLSYEPTELTVLNVINAVEPLERIRQCPLSLGAHEGELCPLHRQLDDAIAMVEKTFGQTTVQDLLGGEGTVEPLCDVPVELSVAATMEPGQRGRPKKRRPEGNGFHG